MITIADLQDLVKELDMQLYQEEKNLSRRHDIMQSRNALNWLIWDMTSKPEKWERYIGSNG